MNETTPDIYARIEQERDQQRKRWGAAQFHFMTPDRCLAILTEEIGEIAREVVELPRRPKPEREEARERLTEEIVQLAACCVAWLEALP